MAACILRHTGSVFRTLESRVCREKDGEAKTNRRRIDKLENKTNE